MSLDGNHKELRKGKFEGKLENIFDMKSLKVIHRIHDSKVITTAGYNLLHDILNPSKFTKNINIHYSPIQHGCMNTCRGKTNLRIFKYYWILDLFTLL